MMLSFPASPQWKRLKEMQADLDSWEYHPEPISEFEAEIR